MLIIAHRGAAGQAPQNSLQAIKSGIASGAPIIEIDVRLSRDGQVVVNHDPWLLKTHGLYKLIKNCDYSFLSSLNPPITTLSQALQACLASNTTLNIEIKTITAVKPTAKLIKQLVPPGKMNNIIVSSFSKKHLAAMRQNLPGTKLALLQHVNSRAFIKAHKQLGLYAVGFNKHFYDAKDAAQAKSMGLFTYVYTIDTPGQAKTAATNGIDAIVTNYPAKLQKLVGLNIHES